MTSFRRSVTYTFNKVGWTRVTLSQTVVATGSVYHLEANVMVKVIGVITNTIDYDGLTR